MARNKSRRSSRARDLPVIAGLAWYDLAQWTKLKQIAEDAQELDDTHEDWQRNAERTERALRRRGFNLRRVPIDIDALVAWCQARGKPLNGESRVEYTAESARKLGPP